MGHRHARVAILTEPRRQWPLVVRRARAADREAVLDFASATWDGWDYVPQAWPVWLTADDGVLLVAVAGVAADGSPPLDNAGRPLEIGRPLAIARVALTSPAEIWLEGIRVDPRVRGLDVATDLQVAELAWARAQGATVIRYATGERNEGSHRLGARHGFRRLTAFRTYWWSVEGEDDDEQSGFDEVARTEVNAQRARLLEQVTADGLAAGIEQSEDWWQALREDATLLAARCLYEHRAWALQELTEAGFDRHVRAGEVLVRGDPRGTWAMTLLEREALAAEDTSLHLGLLCGEPASALGLLSHIQAASPSPLRFRLPADHPPLRSQDKAFAAAGFEAREWTLDILARPLESGEPLPEPSPAGLILEDAPAATIRAPD